jgi:hypothetical protein
MGTGGVEKEKPARKWDLVRLGEFMPGCARVLHSGAGDVARFVRDALAVVVQG